MSFIPQQNKIIAKLLNVNLKTISGNTIPFETGLSGHNTSISNIVIVPSQNNIYSGNGIPEFPANTTVTFDDTKFPSNTSLIYSVNLYVGDIEVNTDPILSGFSTNTEWMDYVKTKFEEDGYTVVINGLNMSVTGATGLGATINGKIMSASTRDENASTFTESLGFSPVFSGGVNAQATTYSLQLDSEEVRIGAQLIINLIPSLLFETNMVSGIVTNAGSSMPIFKTTGNWTLPVTVGTDDDFYVNIYIVGTIIN